MPSAASAASAQPQQQPGDDSHKDIMALLLHGVHHILQQPEALSPRRSDCPASPGLAEAPRRSLSSSPGRLLLQAHLSKKAMAADENPNLLHKHEMKLHPQWCVHVCCDLSACSLSAVSSFAGAALAI